MGRDDGYCSRKCRLVFVPVEEKRRVGSTRGCLGGSRGSVWRAGSTYRNDLGSTSLGRVVDRRGQINDNIDFIFYLCRLFDVQGLLPSRIPAPEAGRDHCNNRSY